MEIKPGIIITLFFIFASQLTSSQDTSPPMPEIMNTGTMEEQMEYLHQRTNIYNNFRAIREDIFQKTRKNVLDSIISAKKEILELNKHISSINSSRDSLNTVLNHTREELDNAVKNRDRLFFMGIPMNKVLYNMIMWSVIGGLLFLMVFIFTLYNRNRVITKQTRKDMAELKEEFENYRKTNREKMERMVIEHFNEIKKYKGG